MKYRAIIRQAYIYEIEHLDPENDPCHQPEGGLMIHTRGYKPGDLDEGIPSLRTADVSFIVSNDGTCPFHIGDPVEICIKPKEGRNVYF